MVDIPPDWAMNAFCTKPNCLALHHKLLTYAGGEFYYADLGANIPTTEDIDFYYSPILASLRDFLSLFLFFAFHTQSVTSTFPHFDNQ